ncbi:MAG: LCP family protein, partial [Chloroflexota bacterium]
DRCYGVDPFEISEGQHHLDGNLALKYARTRATFGSDFDRAARQQTVLIAALDKALDQNISLFARAPQLWNAFQDTVTTSMSYQDVIGLALLVKDIPVENIYRAVIDYNYVEDYTAPDQARVLVPIRERIRDLRDQFFSNALPSTSSEAAEMMIAENIGIEVLNGTFVDGLAGDTVDYLKRRGFIIAGIGDAEEKGQLNTQLIVLGDAPATLDFLAQILEVDPTHIFQGDQVGDKPQIRVILGADWTISAPDQ